MRPVDIFASHDAMSNTGRARRLDCQPVRSGPICKECTMRIVPAEMAFVRGFAVRRLSSGDRSQRHKGGSAPTPLALVRSPTARRHHQPSTARLGCPPAAAAGARDRRDAAQRRPRRAAQRCPRRTARRRAALPWPGGGTPRVAVHAAREDTPRGNRIGSERFRLGRIQPRCRVGRIASRARGPASLAARHAGRSGCARARDSDEHRGGIVPLIA